MSNEDAANEAETERMRLSLLFQLKNSIADFVQCQHEFNIAEMKVRISKKNRNCTSLMNQTPMVCPVIVSPAPG